MVRACRLTAFQAWEAREARRKRTYVRGCAILRAEGFVRADLYDDKSSQLGETAGDAVAQRQRRPRCIILSCTTPPKKCQQLALTADTVASCAAFSSVGMCTPPPSPTRQTRCSESLSDLATRSKAPIRVVNLNLYRKSISKKLL